MRKETFKDMISDYALDGLSFTASIVDHLTNTNIAGMVSDNIANLSESAIDSEPANTPNPLFISNGHSFGGHSETVQHYFFNRRLKKVGGAFFSTIGGIASVASQVNVAGIARHSRAEAKTIAHIVRLKEIASRFNQSEYLTQLFSVLFKMKILKAASRGGQLAADCIPANLASSLVGITNSVGTSIAVKRYSELVLQTSILLHWRAFQELQLGSALGGSGPATQMIHELFGQALRSKKTPDWSTVDRYIRDPAGWSIIQDKINLV